MSVLPTVFGLSFRSVWVFPDRSNFPEWPGGAAAPATFFQAATVFGLLRRHTTQPSQPGSRTWSAASSELVRKKLGHNLSSEKAAGAPSMT
jgi:hypothetical protein